MSARKKKKPDKWVVTLIAGLVAICILLFMLPNLLNQEEVRVLEELKENVIRPHISTLSNDSQIYDFDIINIINISRYENYESQEPTEYTTYEVVVRYIHQQETTEDRTFTTSTVRYEIVMKDNTVVSSRRR
ncbi:hypothetical protein ACERII_13155 [Evansella sp. AB-rgal1]|uniref:hypothetical protein n=1 Tax=Evansella sp. AB-rgal1 TaxID=3242696 RepID=UPI00359CEB86